MRVRMFPALLLLVLFGAAAEAQQFPQPTGPVTFCGVQTPPPADSYEVKFDGVVQDGVELVAPVEGCPAGSTHSFQLPAALFTVGQHTVQVVAINPYGRTEGPVFNVTVGVAPGPFTINAVISPVE